MPTRGSALRSVPTGKRSPISRLQIEGLISRLVAVFGIVFGLQTLPVVFDQIDAANPVWAWIVVPTLYGSIVVALVAAFAQRWVVMANILIAFVYLAALATWPLAVITPTDSELDRYWLYFLMTVATAAAAVGFATPVATLYLFAIPVIYGVIRMTPEGGSASLLEATLEAVYAVLIGGAVVLIVTLLRHAAAAVDVAQSAALDRYSLAVHAHATEIERVQVDSIVHDSVLTTLLSAARAYSPEAKRIASTMASNAIGHLREAALVSPDDGGTVRLSAVLRRVTEAASSMSAPFELRTRDVSVQSMPLQAAEAVYSAAVQAMVNSLQHAGQEPRVSRWLAIRGVEPSGIEIEVGDTGAGFSFVDLPAERMGLRVSIVERVTNAGGSVEIDSAVDEGTVISIRWPKAPATSIDARLNGLTAPGGRL
ncbi:signal transduction histidine kinase [Conyzicola nivalis]|uniref:Signal transduction histidine kinase n=1 Tax=Conyzicola nivalis TaxID=1477021 RepID=A0ABV2QR50_9MICO